MNIQNATRPDLVARYEEILNVAENAGRGLSAEENTELDEISAEVRRTDLYKMQHGTTGTGQRVAPMPLANTADGLPASMSTTVQSHDQSRILAPSGASLKAFSNNNAGREAAFKSGMFIRAAIFGDEKAMTWCRDNGVQNALSGGNSALGGVTIPEELNGAIINLQEQYGLFRRAARVVPMASDTMTIPRKTGGLTSYFVGENQSGTEDDLAWDAISLVAKKLFILTRASSEFASDTIIAWADFLAMEIAQSFSLQEDRCGFNGVGISTDGGIEGVLTKIIDGNHGMAVVEAASTHNLLPEIDATDLIDLMSVIPTYARRGAAWYCSPTAESVVFDAIKVAGGGNTAGDLSQVGVPKFLGYPIHTSDQLPDSTTDNYNDLPMILFGNLSLAATMGTRRGVTVALSEHQRFDQDQISIKGSQRFDVNVHDLGSNSVKSPLACLIGTT